MSRVWWSVVAAAGSILGIHQGLKAWVAGLAPDGESGMF